MNPRWMAFGDVRLSLVVGFGLAWISPIALLEGFAVANLLAAVVGIVLIVAHRAERRSGVPFGLFLALGRRSCPPHLGVAIPDPPRRPPVSVSAVTGALFTSELKERWDTDGWCVVPEVIPYDQLTAAQDAVHRYFPTPAEMLEHGGTEAGAWHTWDAPWPEFPFHSTRLNALVLHERVVDLAEALLGLV